MNVKILLKSLRLGLIPMKKEQPMVSAEAGTTPAATMEMPVDSSIRNLLIVDTKTDAEASLVVFSTDSNGHRVFSTGQKISPLRQTAIRAEAEETTNKKRKKEDKK